MLAKRALLSNILPMPKCPADENFSHNHFIIEVGSFTVQLALVMDITVHQCIFWHFTSVLFQKR